MPLINEAGGVEGGQGLSDGCQVKCYRCVWQFN